MGRSSDNKRESGRVAALAAFAAVVGIIVCIIGAVAWSSEALYNVDRLVKFDTNFSGEWVMTTRRIFICVVWAGGLVIAAGIVGVIGAMSRHKCLICIYVSIALPLAIALAVAGIMAFCRQGAVEPMIERQISDICSEDTYIRLAMNMQCPWAVRFGSSAPACGNLCQERVAMMASIEGCDLIQKLCERNEYEESVNCELMQPNTLATQVAATPPKLLASSTSLDCKQSCDVSMSCDGYFIGSATANLGGSFCILIGASGRSHPPPEWKTPTGIQPGFSCQAKRRGAGILSRFRQQGQQLAWPTLILGAVLLLSSLFAMAMQYNVNVNRQSKPSACEMCTLLFCPCAAKDRKQSLGSGDEEEIE